MKRYNFNQMSPCLVDCGGLRDEIKCPETLPIGEHILVGRYNPIKVVFIPSEKDEETALSYCDMFPEHENKEVFAKCIQYVKSLNGYIFMYFGLYPPIKQQGNN